jgi:hypothetical protein
MARCTGCDREECARDSANRAWWSCHCDESVDYCEHNRASREALADCAAHTVNWRERALAAEAELARFNAVQACNKPAPPEGE